MYVRVCARVCFLWVVGSGLWPAPEFGYAVLVAVMLIARTYADIWMITASTSIESAIISRNGAAFVSSITKFIGGFLPIALVRVLPFSVALGRPTPLFLSPAAPLLTHMHSHTRTMVHVPRACPGLCV